VVALCGAIALACGSTGGGSPQPDGGRGADAAALDGGHGSHDAGHADGGDGPRGDAGLDARHTGPGDGASDAHRVDAPKGQEEAGAAKDTGAEVSSGIDSGADSAREAGLASDGAAGSVGTGGPVLLSMSEGHGCAVVAGGGMKCWGSDAVGQDGRGVAGPNLESATAVLNLPGAVVEVSAAGVIDDGHTLALLATGDVIGWGFNDLAVLGDGTATGPRLLPVSPALAHVVEVRTSYAHSCALDASGALRCWGNNLKGQLGFGDTSTVATTPTLVTLPATAAAVELGSYYTCALLTDARVACWGDNTYDQAAGAANPQLTPVIVSALGHGVARIAAGYDHTCALMATGAVMCWGANDLGQLGSALPAGPTASPLTVSGLPASPVAALCAGSSHTCVLTAGGGVACWGWNYNGQLGDGTNTSRPNPAMVTGLSSGVVEIACGGEATCARLAAGSVECWGSNYQDSLGDGMGADTNTPGSVLGL